MDYRIEKKDAFEVFGIEALISTIDDTNYLAHPSELWKKSFGDGSYDKLFQNAGELPSFVSKDLCKIHAAINYRKTDENTFPYMLCSFVNDKSNTDGYSRAKIPAQTWAIFSSKETSWDNVTEAFSSLYKRFYSEWLPTSDYEKVDGPEFEIYGGTTSVAYFELWIPVTKKQ